jgi:hypothetical protein
VNGLQKIDLPPLSVRAELGSVNDDQRTAELIFSTGAAVTRMDFWTGKRYREVLSMKPEHIRLERLNAGGPLLDSHSAYSVGDVLGTVEPGSARIEKNQGLATVRFSKREAVEPIYQDVRDGIIRHVSVGYRVHKFVEEQGKNEEIPTRTAIDWEPFEISMVPMPADAGARVRNGDKSETNECVIVTRAQETKHMNEQNPEFIAEQNPDAPAAPRTDAPVEKNDRDLGAEQERKRVQGILDACRAARLPQAFADKLIADGVALVDAQTRVFAEMRTRNVETVPSGVARPPIQFGDDPLVHKRKGIENALLHRMAPELFKLDDMGREYRGLSLTDTARTFLNGVGIRTTGLSRNQLWDVALNHRSGMHTTSDFANLLADLPNKILVAAYMEAPQLFGPLVRRITTSDFKPVRLLEVGEAPALKEVLEHGEVTAGTIGESKEQFQLVNYARKFAITRRALINDDTDAFSRLPMQMGRQVRKLESDLVWAQITSNPTMGDGVALFHATHGNLSGTSDAIAVASIAAARTAMRLQKGIDGVTLVEQTPKFLIVPVAKETIADQFVSTNLLASQSSNVNPFAGKLTVIAEPRLDAASTTAWYLASSPDQVEIIVVATLEGEEGPRVESKAGFDVEGIEVKVAHDFAAKVANHRGLYKNPGA